MCYTVQHDEHPYGVVALFWSPYTLLTLKLPPNMHICMHARERAHTHTHLHAHTHSSGSHTHVTLKLHPPTPNMHTFTLCKHTHLHAHTQQTQTACSTPSTMETDVFTKRKHTCLSYYYACHRLCLSFCNILGLSHCT